MTAISLVWQNDIKCFLQNHLQTSHTVLRNAYLKPKVLILRLKHQHFVTFLDEFRLRLHRRSHRKMNYEIPDEK